MKLATVSLFNYTILDNPISGILIIDTRLKATSACLPELDFFFSLWVLYLWGCFSTPFQLIIPWNLNIQCVCIICSQDVLFKHLKLILCQVCFGQKAGIKYLVWFKGWEVFLSLKFDFSSHGIGGTFTFYMLLSCKSSSKSSSGFIFLPLMK